MTLFPQLTDSYYVDNDHNILKRMDYTYAKNIQINQSFWSEADVDARFHAGDQTLYNDIYGNMPAFRRRQFNFNRIRRVINMISGHQRQHRRSTVVTAIESLNEKTASEFTKLLFHVNKNGRILETISDAFEGACITGMNLLSVWNDYRSDPVNGEIMVDNLSYNAYLIDPYFKKRDLSDCNDIWTRKYYSKVQAKSLLPGREKDIDSLPAWGNRDGKFQFEPESYNYGMQDLLIFDEFWYLDSREQKNLVDTQTGECVEWRGQEEDLKLFMHAHPNITIVTSQIPTVKLAIVVQGKVFYNGPNPLGIDRYPFVPVWAYYHPEIPYFPWRAQGVVRGIRDAQYLYNRQKILSLDLYESQVHSGFIFKENSLVNPKDVFLQGAGKGIALKQDADISDIQKIQPPGIDPTIMQLTEMLGKEISELSGVNEELLGAADDDKAGILSMLRQGASLTTLQGLFDSLDQSQKLLGDIMIEVIQNNWTVGKVQRILGHEPSQQFYNRVFGKYDAVVEDGINTSTQRQMQFAQLLHLRELGIPVPTDLLINSSTLQDKDKLIESIQQENQQQQQMQQEQHQQQMAVMQAQIQDLNSKSMANEGLGMERASRIHENRALAVERIAEAERNRDAAALDKVRAAKELTDIDLNQIERAMNIIRMLKEEDIQQSQKVAQQQMSNTGT